MTHSYGPTACSAPSVCAPRRMVPKSNHFFAGVRNVMEVDARGVGPPQPLRVRCLRLETILEARGRARRGVLRDHRAQRQQLVVHHRQLGHRTISDKHFALVAAALRQTFDGDPSCPRRLSWRCTDKTVADTLTKMGAGSLAAFCSTNALCHSRAGFRTRLGDPSVGTTTCYLGHDSQANNLDCRRIAARSAARRSCPSFHSV